jgi:hypothetical protein
MEKSLVGGVLLDIRRLSFLGALRVMLMLSIYDGCGDVGC